MLKEFFAWLDGHPRSYWALAVPSTLVLLTWIGASVRAELRGREILPGSACGRRVACFDVLVIVIFLLAWRWPYLLSASEYNPDESQLIAGAITLTHDPVFWRSVDGTTSGPLNFYILSVIKWLGLPLDYFTARVMGLLLIGGALFTCLRALAGAFGRAVAWLGVLPATVFFGTVMTNDFIHYSSEHLSLLLTAVPMWLLATRQAGDQRRIWAACAIAGAAPWAKLQVVPISVALIGWALWQVRQDWENTGRGRWRPAGAAILAAAAPTFLALGFVLACGQLDPAMRRYFLLNLYYTERAQSLADALGHMYGFAKIDGRMPGFLLTSGAVLGVAMIFLGWRRARPSALVGVGAILSFAAVVAVVAPRREFLHYSLLLPIPLTLLVGAAIGDCWRQVGTRSRVAVASLLLLAAVPLLVSRYRMGVPAMYGNFLYHWKHPRGASGMLVSALAGREGSVGVWGWAPKIYAETGLPQATRDAHTVWSILPSGQRDYLRHQYLTDLRRHAPPVFVDATGPGAFAFTDRRAEGHEIFPELAAEIRRNYQLIYDLGEARVYARAGLADSLGLNIARLDELVARARHPMAPESIESMLTPETQLQRWVIDGRRVVMLPPPTHLEWKLDANVRQVWFEFGFHPSAYVEGTTNGAELILELTEAGSTRVIWHRMLNPKRLSADRGPQLAVVTLPTFSADTHLVLRSDAGPYGDTAWDWVYLANMEFERRD